jgi:hypothetical protein
VVAFTTFAEISRAEAKDRPAWFPVAPLYDQPSPGPPLPDPLRLEQGSRAAGALVGPFFPIFFALQAGCAVVALVSAAALGLSGGARKARFGVLLLAALGVGVGWWLERVVHDLREPRNQATDAYLAAGEEHRPQIEADFRRDRAEFARWHGYSLVVHLVTLGLVGVAAALAGLAPGDRRPSRSAPS